MPCISLRPLAYAGQFITFLVTLVQVYQRSRPCAVPNGVICLAVTCALNPKPYS